MSRSAETRLFLSCDARWPVKKCDLNSPPREYVGDTLVKVAKAARIAGWSLSIEGNYDLCPICNPNPRTR